MPGWYPPPGQNGANSSSSLTVDCGGSPPEHVDQTECFEEWCLFNLTADPCEYKNIAKDNPDAVASLRARLKTLSKTTVRTWVDFSERNTTESNPEQFGPTTPITPDPQTDEGPHIYQGVWKPWLTNAKEKTKYPSAYVGPGY